MAKFICYECDCGHIGQDQVKGKWNQKCFGCNSKIAKYKIVYNPKEKEKFVNVCFDENIRVSRSLGVPITQFEEAKKAHPGVDWVKRGHSMCPVIHNRAEKLKIMKQAGMEEYPANHFNN